MIAEKTEEITVNLTLNAAEAGVIRDMIGPYSQHAMQQLEGKCDQNTAKEIGVLYHTLSKMLA